jgi:CBS domain-containing protein
MKLREVMTRKVEFVEPTQSLREAAQLMRQYDIGPIPVCSAGRVVGMLTDRDIAIRAVAEGRDPKTTAVRDIMSTDISSCGLDDDVKDAAKLMADKQIRRLVVLDAERRLAGIVSLGDLAVGVDDPIMVGKIMEDVSQPSHGTSPGDNKPS